MLDFDSYDIDGMDVDAGDDLEPPPTGRWTTTSSYNIYMVDTPKEGNGDKKDTTKDKPTGQKPKRWRRRRSKSSHSKNRNNSTRKNNTPADSNGNNMNPAMEQEEPGHAEQTPITAIPRAEIIKLPTEGRTVRLTMHLSSQKNAWNKITSAEGLWPRRGA